MWTSAHGFHHYTLSNRKGWRLIWAFILFILVVALVACIAYYFYYVFSTAVYSRFILESPDQRSWPTTIICEKQAFKPSRISQIPSLTTSHASLLSWTLSPHLSRPGVYATNARIPSLISEIDQILLRAEYGNQMNKLINAMVPNCTDFILECTVGSTTYKGQDCCGNFVDATPVLTRYGTCFTTKTALIQHSLIIAGEGSGFQVPFNMYTYLQKLLT